MRVSLPKMPYKNKQVAEEYRKKYYQEHREEKHQKKFLYDRTLHGIFINLKYSAKKRNIDINFSENEFINWYDNQEQKCYYCNRTLEEVKKDYIFTKNFHRFSIDRKNNDRSYELNNIVLACFNCNRIKGNFFNEEEMIKIGFYLCKEIY